MLVKLATEIRLNETEAAAVSAVIWVELALVVSLLVPKRSLSKALAAAFTSLTFAAKVLLLTMFCTMTLMILQSWSNSAYVRFYTLSLEIESRILTYPAITV